MRKLITLFLAVLCLNLWAQPVNDLCSNAIEINLPMVNACPSIGTAEVSLSASNLGATTTTPGIQLTEDFGNGPQLNNIAADVWFAFTPTANEIRIQVEGDIALPSIVLFHAISCDSKIPVEFALPDEGGTLNTAVVPGQSYLIMVAGNDINDQGTFTMNIRNNNNCNTCNRRQGIFQVEPAPENGTYSAGQEVQFCYNIESWDPGFMLEWLHGLELNFGEGWDLNSLTYTSPSSCTPGSWSWYDSWIGCNTNESFGPGFAFDAAYGLLCPGASANDGIPGNNFGDGPCGSLEVAPLPLTFCWSLKVKDSFASVEEANLNIKVSLFGDGYSGSWMQYSCTDESTSQFLATAVPAMALMPELIVVSDACANLCDGQLNILGQGNSSWQYALYNDNDDMIYSAPAFNGQEVVDGLCPGNYKFELTQTNTNFIQSLALNIPEVNLPDIQIGHLPACNEGDSFQLVTGTSTPLNLFSFSWTGPDNYSSISSSPLADTYGTYTLQAAIDDCLLPEETIDVEPMRTPVSCFATDNDVTFSWEPLPNDTAYEVIVLTGQSGIWIDDYTYKVEGLNTEESVEVELHIEGTGFCSTSLQYANCETLSCELPAVTEEVTTCAGSGVMLYVDDTDLEDISWSPTTGLSCTNCPNPIATPSSTTTYQVTTNSTTGCEYTQTVTVLVNSLSTELLPDESVPFCPGEPFEFCLPEGNRYLWMSPIGFIKTGNCLVFPYTNQSITGEYLIRVSLSNGCQFFETLTIYPDCDESLIGQDMGNLYFESAPVELTSVRVFPNPAQDVLHLKFDNDHDRSIQLYDLTGQLLLEYQTSMAHFQFDLMQLPAATYLLSIRSEEGLWQEKIVKTE